MGTLHHPSSSHRFSRNAQGPRAQIDRTLYKKNMQDILFNYPNLDVCAGSVFDLVLDTSPDSNSGATQYGSIKGVKLGKSTKYPPSLFC